MTGSWRAFMMTAVLVLAAAGVSTAQTVTVTRATAGSKLEVSLNGAAVGDTTVGADGIASVDVDLPKRLSKNEADVRVSVEVCGTLVHVLLVETGLELPAANPDCTHSDITGVFVMRQVTTFVVDVAPSTPAVWLMQGPAPKTWLHPELVQATEGRTWRPQPKGLVIAGGGGFSSLSDFGSNECATATTCSGKLTRLSVHGEATYWFSRSLGAAVSFLRPSDIQVSGSDTNYTFNSTLQTRLLTIGVKLGIPAGPVRIYGIGGAAYHWAVASTTNAVSASTITVNGVATPVPGGTEQFGVNAPAWGWMAGGGIEISMVGPVSLYAEGGYAPIKGADKNPGDARIDDRIIYAVGGIQVHLWR